MHSSKNAVNFTKLNKSSSTPDVRVTRCGLSNLGRQPDQVLLEGAPERCLDAPAEKFRMYARSAYTLVAGRHVHDPHKVGGDDVCPPLHVFKTHRPETSQRSPRVA